MPARHGRLPFLIAVSLLVSAVCALAHPAPYSYVDLHVDGARVHGSVVAHAWDVAHEIGLSAETDRGAGGTLLSAVAARLAQDGAASFGALLGSRIHLHVDGVPVVVRWTSHDIDAGRDSVRFVFDTTAGAASEVTLDAVPFPYDPQHQVFVNVYRDGTLAHQAILDAAHATMTWSPSTIRRSTNVLATFVPAGIHHILIGPDHILFVLALLLAGGGWRRLAVIVTSFTAGHSITLALATLDIANPPASIVEPAIALSIIVVGLDNLLAAESRERRDLRAWAAGTFGLLHGFGFASVLRDMSLPTGSLELAAALAGFNVGVEIGQLLIVVAVSVPLVLVRRMHHAAAQRLVYVTSVCVVIAGGWWFIERTLLAGGR